MGCRLIQNIKHSCEYNAGGIKEILLLDIQDFIGFQFLGDKLFNECYVEMIKVAVRNYIHLDVVDSSNFTETFNDNIYTQKLTTFIRAIDHTKTSNLLLARSNKYVVAFRTTEDKCFVFGSDGGASISFSQQTGQLSEGSGYSISIEKESIYPLFEIDIDNTINIYEILSTEDYRAITTEDYKAISIKL